MVLIPPDHDRRNPYSSLSEAEYQLLTEQMKSAARQGANEAIGDHLKELCIVHRERLESVESAVFGRTEKGIVGLDTRLSIAEATLQQLRRVTWTAVSALVVALIGFVLQLVLGR